MRRNSVTGHPWCPTGRLVSLDCAQRCGLDSGYLGVFDTLLAFGRVALRSKHFHRGIVALILGFHLRHQLGDDEDDRREGDCENSDENNGFGGHCGPQV
ncbi:hypothetical protein [Mycobacterium sp.]|uniref:hypothetical protein n=1 Tax=Mycobacterium sp. TaxID=1785 RepID=UPI0025DC1FE9|nr:hypothetical protein [Mycobacterium sp.]